MISIVLNIYNIISVYHINLRIHAWLLNSRIANRSHPIKFIHYSDAIINVKVSQMTGVSIVFSTVYLGTYQRKHHSSASLAFVRVIHWWPVDSPHKGSLKRKVFPFDYAIMQLMMTLTANRVNDMFLIFHCRLFTITIPMKNRWLQFEIFLNFIQ